LFIFSLFSAGIEGSTEHQLLLLRILSLRGCLFFS